MKKTIEELIEKAFVNLGMEPPNFTVEHPVDLKLGDYSTNAALLGAKNAKMSPADLANKLVEELRDIKDGALIERIEAAGAGFINFHLSNEFFIDSLDEIIKKDHDFGKDTDLEGEKTIVEYTDPNPFKKFHIGHLMSNTIGEALSRIVEWNGAQVKRACYQGDVGLHVAKAIWAMLKGEKADPYARGARAYEESEVVKKEIEEINRKIYSKEDKEINELYEAGKRNSLEDFASIYWKLGTHFDYFFFESEVAPVGEKIVKDNVGKIFEESDGAIVFKGEKFDPKLHTRVFINNYGIPTYEAKELGLAKVKHDTYPYERSIVITGNEVNDYFRVLLEAMKQVFPELADKTDHISHGMLRMPSGKMSSRTGDVITTDELIQQVKDAIQKKGNEPQDKIAVAALKYMILKASPGNDAVFDMNQAISTEGDSGPYLQYAYVRAKSVFHKNPFKDDLRSVFKAPPVHDTTTLERLLYRLPEIVERAGDDFAPQYIITYLTEVASAFNNFYAHNQIINPNDVRTSLYRLAITKAAQVVLGNGMTVLGIPLVEKM